MTDRNNHSIFSCPFPLDKVMTLETALSFFLEVYDKHPDKGVLLNNSPETKRLREGYWGILACAALDKLENKNHYILFPSKNTVDLLFISERKKLHRRPQVNALEFDVKEYTHHSRKNGFVDFIMKKVRPHLSSYGIIVGVHEDIGILDPVLLQIPENDRGLFVVSAASAESRGVFLGRAAYFHGLDNPIHIDIDLTGRVILNNQRVIFSNELIRRPI